MHRPSRHHRSSAPLGAVLLLAWVTLAAETPTRAAGAPAVGTNRALLVGVADYPHLRERYRLSGPTNDVTLMRRMLVERFEFEPEDVVELTGGLEGDHAPTRANIAGAFARLAEASGPDDQVVILLAGHGSQLPADDDPDDPETDGWDETFLPLDVRGWPGGAAEESIRDDELRAWVGAIAAKGAFVWLIADSCNSGTLLRGAPEQTRWIPPEDLLGPKPAGDGGGAGTQTRGAAGSASERDVLGLPSESPNIVATYAALPDQQTPEGTFHGTRQGLFTYTIVKVLEQADGPLTYRELADRVRTEYGLRPWPTPFVEGGGQDREVLGLREWPALPRFHLQQVRGGTLRVDAGDLQGIRPGSILAVYPPAGSEGSHAPIGHVRVGGVESLSSIVEPVAWAGMAAPQLAALPDGSRCAVVHTEYGSGRVRVAIQSETPGSNGSVVIEVHAPGEGPTTVEQAWSRLGEGLVERVTDTGSAEWLVRIVGGEVILGPVTGWPSGAPAFFTIPGSLTSDPLAERLRAALGRVAKSNQLIGLAGGSTGIASSGRDSAGGTTGSGSGGIGVELVATRISGRGPRGVLESGPAGIEVLAGDSVELRVKNVSASPESGVAAPTLDVGLFYVDAEHAITLLMPSAEFAAPDSRLKPGEEQPVRISISGEPAGWEQVVVLAIPVHGAQTPDFSVWSTDQTRGVAAPGAGQEEQLQDFAAIHFPWRTLKD